MKLKDISKKIQKLKSIWEKQGIRVALFFLYQRLLLQLPIDRAENRYNTWQIINQLTKKDIQQAQETIEKWSYLPKFSIIMPVYNVESKWLKKAIESVKKQIYTHWELCIVDDASTSPEIRPMLERYSKQDNRIKIVFRTENGNISAASNSALEMATGDYITLLDHDDEITIDALYENAKLINQYPDADFIYSDEDKIDTKGIRSNPFFKPDWSPDYFHACMYTCHLGVYRKSLIDKIGGFRSEYDGAQDYDLVLRIVEQTNKIYHIPRVLYHWRMIPASAAASDQAKPWANQAAQRALQAMIDRSPYPGHVKSSHRPGHWRVRRDILGEPLISIIIPSAGKTKPSPQGEICVLKNCLQSIETLSTYKNIEIIIVDGYDIPEFILQAIESPHIRLVHCSEPFNFSSRINHGVAQAKGEILLLLNDDTEVLTPDWIESMLEFAQQNEIGAVGAKLFFPDKTIQHVGVTVLGGTPGHVYYGVEGEHPGYVLSNVVNRNYIAVTGACLMVRKDLFDKVGGMDVSFPLNYNDVDFCLKLHQAGYRNVVTPYAQLIHYESVSRHNELKTEEVDNFNNKWKPYIDRVGYDPYYNPNLSDDGLMMPK